MHFLPGGYRAYLVATLSAVPTCFKAGFEVSGNGERCHSALSGKAPDGGEATLVFDPRPFVGDYAKNAILNMEIDNPAKMGTFPVKGVQTFPLQHHRLQYHKIPLSRTAGISLFQLCCFAASNDHRSHHRNDSAIIL